MIQAIIDALGKIEIWVSVFLAIPFAIAVNLLTPWLQKRWERWLETYKKVKIETRTNKKKAQLLALERELKKITTLHSEPSRFNTYILMQLVKIAFVSSFATIYAGGLGILQALELGRILEMLSSILIQAVTLLSAFAIFSLCKQVIERYRKITNFKKFKTESELMIQQLKNET